MRQPERQRWLDAPIRGKAGREITSAMTTTGMAIFAFVLFLIPVPIIHWLDSPGRGSDEGQR